MNESEKLAEQQITETIIEEIDKLLIQQKKENGLSSLEIVHEYDSFAFSFLKDASQGKLKKDNVFNEIKISLASCESPLPGEKKRSLSRK